MTPKCYLTMLLIQSIIHGLDCSSGYIPTDVKCEAITNAPSNVKRISWSFNQTIVRNVRVFEISCNCTESGRHEPFTDLFHNCHSFVCSYQASFNISTCYEECYCNVRSVTYDLHNPEKDWSNASTCYIGPTVPKAAPMIISSPERTHDENSILIAFKLPAENLHCDSTETINNITVNVTDPVTGSHQYICDRPRPLHNDERSYACTFQVDRSQLWRPLYISIAVMNSIGFSPFSDHMIVTGASNGDITRSDYELEFYYDWSPVESMSYFHWQLSEKAENMIFVKFITGFHVILEQQLDNNDNNLTMRFKENKNLTLNETMENKDLIVNITLEPNQWYLLIGRMLTEDDDTWGPEAVYKYFKTPGSSEQLLSEQSSSSDNNYWLVIILSVIIILFTIVAVGVVLYITRSSTKLSKLCCADDDDDNYTDKMNEMIGTIAGSIAEYRCEPSYVENISSAGYYSKSHNDHTADDLDSVIDEYNRRILQTTAV